MTGRILEPEPDARGKEVLVASCLTTNPNADPNLRPNPHPHPTPTPTPNQVLVASCLATMANPAQIPGQGYD